MRKDLYKRFQKELKVKKKYDEKVVIIKTSILKTILSFLYDFVFGAIKVIYYILIVALCSIGATYLFNLLLKGGFLKWKIEY